MNTTYCGCESPVFDPDHDAGCRRCGLPVDFTPTRPGALVDDGVPRELYYVCGQCGYTVSSPELPESCECCRAPYTALAGYRTLADAEESSQAVLEAKTPTRGPSASELHGRASRAEL